MNIVQPRFAPAAEVSMLARWSCLSTTRSKQNTPHYGHALHFNMSTLVSVVVPTHTQRGADSTKERPSCSSCTFKVTQSRLKSVIYCKTNLMFYRQMVYSSLESAKYRSKFIHDSNLPTLPLLTQRIIVIILHSLQHVALIATHGFLRFVPF